jgi:hypothetical protein
MGTLLRSNTASLLASLFLSLLLAVAQAATVTVSPRPAGGTVTSNVGGLNCGTGGSACTSSNIALGASVTLTATPDAGYSFVRWTVDGLGQSTDNPLTFPMGNVNLAGSVTFRGTAPAFTSANSATFQVGAAGSFTVTATGTPAPTFAHTAGSLPSGVSFAADGSLTGTPAAGTGGQYPVTITASNGVPPDATQGFTLTVNQPPAFTNVDSGTAAQHAAYSFQFTATGWPPPSFSTGSPSPGLTLSASGLLSGVPQAGGSFNVYVTAANGVAPSATQKFTLTVTELCDLFGPYLHTMQAGTSVRSTFLCKGYPPCTCAVELGSLPPGIAIEQPCMAFAGTLPKGSAGVYQVWLRATNTVSSYPGGPYILTVEEAPEFTSPPSATFVAGAARTFTVTASGLPAPTFSVSSGSLPSGVNLATDGTLSGTPVVGTEGTHFVTILAANGRMPNATQAFTLTVVAAAGDADGDGIPNGVEITEGRDPGTKDNDVFANARLFAMQMYRDFLNREGDPAGITGWTDLVTTGTYTRNQVIDAFLSSDEFAGFVAPVVRLYFATFLRVPDYGGLVFNAGLVRNATLTPVQLADFFANSPEFLATYGPLDNAAFVTLLYNNILGRAPDPAGLSGWVGLLAGGMSRGQVLYGFAESTEYRGAMANEVFVTMMYAGMLRRTPEPGGFNGWVGFLDAGTYTREQVIGGFFLSTEYRARFLP